MPARSQYLKGTVPVPAKNETAIKAAGSSVGSQGSQGRRVFKGMPANVLAELGDFFTTYIELPPRVHVVLAAWVLAAWLAFLWDRFPHLAITSPEKRCGKTRLLQILQQVTPRPLNTSNITPAALFRFIE